MTCPSCHQEYSADVRTCPQCGVPLVDQASTDAPDPDLRLVTVFTSENPALVAMARSLLDEEQIDYTVNGDVAQELGWVGSAMAVDFQVREGDADRARGLLADLVSSPVEAVSPEDGAEPAS